MMLLTSDLLLDGGGVIPAGASIILVGGVVISLSESALSVLLPLLGYMIELLPPWWTP